MAEEKTVEQRANDAAVKFLKSKGYDIVKRNYKNGKHTCDVVCTLDNTVVFVNVSLNDTAKAGMVPDDNSKDYRKEREIGAALFLQEHDFLDMPVRFDEIAVLILAEDKALIRHHINSMGVA